MTASIWFWSDVGEVGIKSSTCMWQVERGGVVLTYRLSTGFDISDMMSMHKWVNRSELLLS